MVRKSNPHQQVDSSPFLPFSPRQQITKKLVHYTFCATLSNDFFGIAGRWGSSCAGPHALSRLSVSDEEAHLVDDTRIER